MHIKYLHIPQYKVTLVRKEYSGRNVSKLRERCIFLDGVLPHNLVIAAARVLSLHFMPRSHMKRHGLAKTPELCVDCSNEARCDTIQGHIATPLDVDLAHVHTHEYRTGYVS